VSSAGRGSCAETASTGTPRPTRSCERRRQTVAALQEGEPTAKTVSHHWTTTRFYHLRCRLHQLVLFHLRTISLPTSQSTETVSHYFQVFCPNHPVITSSRQCSDSKYHPTDSIHIQSTLYMFYVSSRMFHARVHRSGPYTCIGQRSPHHSPPVS
jgi:hypothetical protein